MLSATVLLSTTRGRPSLTTTRVFRAFPGVFAGTYPPNGLVPRRIRHPRGGLFRCPRRRSPRPRATPRAEADGDGYVPDRGGVHRSDRCWCGTPGCECPRRTPRGY